MESIRNTTANSAEMETSFINILNLVFDKCPDGIVFKDKNLCYRVANRAFYKCCNIKNERSLLGKKENLYIPDNIMKLIKDADKEVMESASPINYVINTGNDILLNITTFPILYNNIFSGLISIVKDITQEEALKEDFVNKHFEYIDSEKKLQTQRETFVASLGHDLKNPTIAQIRSLELLLKGSFGKISEEQEELLQMVLDSCRYMNGMLSSLLATYRDYGGTVKLNFEDFALSELVSECVSEMIYVAKDKGINILINNNFATQKVKADRVQIKRVIMNLLSNGIKYAFTNTDLILNIYQSDKNAHFEFINKSPYIPKEKQNAIFSQYVSYASAHNELGIGLGLYASKKIIEAHNGTIFVESNTNEQNKFGFRIPIEQNDIKNENLVHF